jgi:hypothetical protein
MVRSSAAEIPGAPAVKVIDVHAHIFNARDLPLRGVLEVIGAPESVDASACRRAER